MARLRVQDVAKSKGVGINKLSRISDISTNTVRRMWHNPNYDATLSTLQKIASVLGVSIHELIADDDESPLSEGEK